MYNMYIACMVVEEKEEVVEEDAKLMERFGGWCLRQGDSALTRIGRLGVGGELHIHFRRPHLPFMTEPLLDHRGNAVDA